MKKIKLLVIIIIVLDILSLNHLIATAETFVDLYAGMSLGSGEGLTFIAPGVKTTEEADLSNSFTIGYRMGHWFKGLDWAGVALEASHFKHDIRHQNIDKGYLRVTPVSGLIMFRIPLLKRDIYPNGEYFFYGGIGPGIFLTSIKYEVTDSEILDKLDLGSLNASERSIDIGLDVRGGIAKMIREHISLFCEYRYTDVSPDFEEKDIPDNKLKIETGLNTHHVLIGFTYHYN